MKFGCVSCIVFMYFVVSNIVIGKVFWEIIQVVISKHE